MLRGRAETGDASRKQGFHNYALPDFLEPFPDGSLMHQEQNGLESGTAFTFKDDVE